MHLSHAYDYYALMDKTLLKQYSILVEFLAASLGPDYEVVLHDLADSSKSIVAIANGYISGRSLGAPLTNKALEMMAGRLYEKSDYYINYASLSGDNKILRSSSLYIKDKTGKPVALLCINFDDSRYDELSSLVLKLCHPDAFVDKHFSKSGNGLAQEEREEAERFPDSIEAVTDSVIGDVVLRQGITVERLTHEEKLGIIAALDKKGVFLLKGAVSHVAEVLKSSEASIYRYLAKIERQQSKNS